MTAALHGGMRRRAMRRLLLLVGAVLVLGWSLAPIVWILIASITPEHQTTTVGAMWQSSRAVEYFPHHPTLANYVALFDTVPFGIYSRNSAIIATGSMALALTVGSLGGYGFVRFRFRGRSPMLSAMLMAYMIPSVVLLVPLMVLFRRYGLINTYLGMILAEATITAPFVLLLMINYFASLPAELEEQAQVDGCTRLGALIRVVVPLALPGLVSGGLLAFIMTWNDFLFAYLFTTSDSVKTLPVIMRLFALGEPAVWGVSAAGALLATLPVAALFLIFQRMLISGLAAGAVKG
jgi:ABC-type glycerol-3-phosphate transport system permease component